MQCKQKYEHKMSIKIILQEHHTAGVLATSPHRDIVTNSDYK